MFYAIINNNSSASATYTGVVYDYINENIIKSHKEQGYFIEPMETAITPINKDEITAYEMDVMMSPSGDHGIPPIPKYKAVTKNDAMNAMELYIQQIKSEKNKENFVFDGHEYFADQKSIQATQNQCLTMADTDAIPVAGGKWKTAEVDNDGNAVFVSFTVSQFKNFAKTLFDRGAANFANKESHMAAIKTIVNDDAKTVNDVFGYDYSTGWNA